MGSKTEFPGFSSHEEERPDTTFPQDFRIAEVFGALAMKDTFKRCFDEWKGNIKYMTELTIVTNNLMWDRYNSGSIALSKLYESFWKRCDEWCCTNFKGDDLEYFLAVTD